MKNNTLKSILSSILVISLCISLIAGSTFALFTSESGVNIAVNAGKVDVKASVKNLKLESLGVEQNGDTFANGGTALFNSTTGILSLTNITPGDKVTFDIEMENNSNVIVQYRVTWSVDGELADVLVATVDGVEIVDNTTEWAVWAIPANDEAKVETLNIEVSLPKDVGNKYQEKKANVVFTVEAVQYNAVVKEVTTVEELETLFEVGGTAKLMNNIALDAGVKLTVNEDTVVSLDLGEYTISGTSHKSVGAVIENNGTLTLENGKIASTAANGGSAIKNNGVIIITGTTLNGASNADDSWPAYTVNNTGVMTVNNASITSVHGAVASYGEDAVVTLNNTNIDMSGIPGFTSHGIYTYNNGKVVVNGGDIANKATDQNSTGGSVINGNVTINSGNFTGRIDAYYGTPVICGGTFNTDPSKFVAEYYKASLDDATGLYEIVYADNVEEASDNTELDEAIKADKDVIFLGSGTYNIPASAKSKTLTIIGTKDSIIEVVPAGQGEANGQLDYNFDGSNVTFNGVTIKTNNQTYAGYARLSATYNNCTFENHYSLQRDSVFNNCVFNISGDQYNIWTWGAPNATFNGCTFNSDGKALLLYGTVDTNLTVNNCTFNDNGGLTDLKAAIEIGNDYGKSYTLTVNNTTVNGYEINDKGIDTGTTLWANKSSMSKDNLNVVIDGVDVY